MFPTNKKARSAMCAAAGPVLVSSVQLSLFQTLMHTAALRGTRFSEARFVFMDLIMSTKRMVFDADDNTGTPYLFL